jgi:hypothetical protein
MLSLNGVSKAVDCAVDSGEMDSRREWPMSQVHAGRRLRWEPQVDVIRFLPHLKAVWRVSLCQNRSYVMVSGGEENGTK